MLPPLLKCGNAVHDRLCGLPLPRELLNCLVCQVGVGDLHFVIEVEEGQIGLAPSPIGEFSNCGEPRAVQSSVEIGRADTLGGYASQYRLSYPKLCDCFEQRYLRIHGRSDRRRGPVCRLVGRSRRGPAMPRRYPPRRPLAFMKTIAKIRFQRVGSRAWPILH